MLYNVPLSYISTLWSRGLRSDCLDSYDGIRRGCDFSWGRCYWPSLGLCLPSSLMIMGRNKLVAVIPVKRTRTRGRPDHTPLYWLSYRPSLTFKSELKSAVDGKHNRPQCNRQLIITLSYIQFLSNVLLISTQFQQLLI